MVQTITFGQWLRQQRKGLDITQDMLAEKVGCTLWAIQKIESGTRRPSRQVAELLADVFSVPDGERNEFIRFARTDRGWISPTVVDGPVVPFLEDEVGHDHETFAPGLPQANDTHNSASKPPPTNLPGHLTRLIGREHELSEIHRRILVDGVRLLTLVGPPGIGKTRLALGVAADMFSPEGEIDHLHYPFPDGVYFVALAPVRDPNLVLVTVAYALGVEESGVRNPVQDLSVFLRDKRMLLVLDNFEQVIDAAPQIAGLLSLCPQVSIVVTSRETLNLLGEQQFHVNTLAQPSGKLPEPGAGLAPALLEYPSVALFVERAQAVRHDFSLTEANAHAVMQICLRLDGLPLAIELAAARIRMLSVQELLARLDSRLKVLTGGGRDLPERQQTLRGAIDWSYNLLDPAEQTLLARMGVFAGSTSLSAIEAVCSDRPMAANLKRQQTGGPPTDKGPSNLTLASGSPDPQLLEGLASLLDKSLITQNEGIDGEPCFSMLEMIREYAFSRLQEMGEAGRLQAMHGEYYLALAEDALFGLKGPDQAHWFRRIELEHDNMRAALTWAGETGDSDLELRLAGALLAFWHPRTYVSEGRAWLERALARPAAQVHSWPRTRALYGAALLAWLQIDFEASRARSEECYTLAEELGDKIGMAYGMGTLSMYGQSIGHPMMAEWTARSIALFREIGDNWGLAWFLTGAGMTALEHGDMAGARGPTSGRVLPSTKPWATCGAWQRRTPAWATWPCANASTTKPGTGTSRPSPGTMPRATGGAWAGICRTWASSTFSRAGTMMQRPAYPRHSRSSVRWEAPYISARSCANWRCPSAFGATSVEPYRLPLPAWATSVSLVKIAPSPTASRTSPGCCWRLGILKMRWLPLPPPTRATRHTVLPAHPIAAIPCLPPTLPSTI